MREIGGIINIYENKVTINIENFYDNLKVSLKYNGQDDEFGIQANADMYFKNTMIEIFEHLKKDNSVVIFDKGDGIPFVKIEDFLKWIMNENNLSLGIEKHRDFIEKVYNHVEENGIY